MTLRRALITAAALAAAATPALAQDGEMAGTWAFLSLGFVIGMAHAMEADHLTALATLSDRRDGRRALVLRGAFWGLGHTAALFAICSTVIFLGLSISGRLAAGLELAVGLMIIGLGLRVFWKLHRERIHIHVHDHGGNRHIHAHSHAGDGPKHQLSTHDHRHRAKGHLGIIAIGLVHGAAGSAALLVLTVAATESLGLALVYLALFGIGSLLGMSLLTAMASYPLGLIGRGAQWMKTATTLTIGGLAIGVGGLLAVESLAGLWLAG